MVWWFWLFSRDACLFYRFGVYPFIVRRFAVCMLCRRQQQVVMMIIISVAAAARCLHRPLQLLVILKVQILKKH